MDYNCLKEQMKSVLTPKRYAHSMLVAERAKLLAHKYGCDEQKAYLAGLIHDFCKDMTQDEQLKWLKKSDIISEDDIFKQPNIWHGIAASVYLKEQLGITDKEILSAVRYHTTAKKDMTLLEKVIYVADLTSQDRKYDGVQRLRELAEQDLDAAVSDILVFTIADLARRRLLIGKNTYLAYNQYMAMYADKNI